jgi:predicted DNA-binding protein (UPF0251 family)
MPRKRCCGQIEEYPICRKFVSEQSSQAEVMKLAMEEMEALRLKDMIGYDQEECARQMGLTRPTFQRVLASARRKTATALAEARTIAIEGGHYQMKNRVFECTDCKTIWEVAPCTEGGKHGYEIACPKCGSMKKSKLDDGVKHACGGENHTHSDTDASCGCGCVH